MHNVVIFLSRAASYGVKYLSNDSYDLKNGFYEEKKMKSIYLPFSGDKNLRFGGFKFDEDRYGTHENNAN